MPRAPSSARHQSVHVTDSADAEVTAERWSLDTLRRNLHVRGTCKRAQGTIRTNERIVPYRDRRNYRQATEHLARSAKIFQHIAEVLQ